MSVRTDTVNLQVNIKGNQAQKELGDLRKKAADIKFEMQGLKKGTAEYIAKSEELAKVTGNIDELKKRIGLTALTLKELRQEQTKLNALLSSSIPFSEEYKKYQEQLSAVNDRIFEVKNGVQGFSATFAKISGEIKNFSVLALAYLGFEQLTDTLQNIIPAAGDVSDKLADIRKATGLTAQEVEVFNTKLQGLDTRSLISDLQDIAVVGGQLGIAKEDILAFTTSIDKLNVALGDEFAGGAEEITNAVGGIRQTFKDLQSGKIDEDLLKIGNALNVLGAEGRATAPVVTDFAQRIGGAGQVYGLTAGQVFGLSAALQELNITAERGSTAVVKILQRLSSSPELFYDIARSVDPSIKSLNDFKTLINTDINKAFLLISKGFANGETNATAFAEKLGDAEISSASITEVLAKVGQNTQFVSSKIDLATIALTNIQSVLDEFNIKNNTFGATLNKISKEFTLFENSESVRNFLSYAAMGALNFIRAIRDLPSFIAQNSKAFATLTTGLILMNAKFILSALAAARDTIAKAANAVVTRAVAAANALAVSAQASYITVTNLLTGRITLATAAQRLYNIALTLSARAIGGIIAAAGAAAIAFTSLLQKTQILSDQERLRAEVNARVAESTQEQIEKITLLTKVAGDNNVSLDNRRKALDALIALNPTYLKGLTLENITTAEGTKKIDEYVKSLTRKAEIEAKIALRNAKLQEKANLDLQLPKLRTDAANQNPLLQIFGDNFGFGANNEFNKTLDSVNTLTSDIAQLNKEIEKTGKKDITKVLGTAAETLTNTVDQADHSVGGLKKQIKSLDDEFKKLDKSNKEAIAANRKTRAELASELKLLEGKKLPKSSADRVADQTGKDQARLKEMLLKNAQDVDVINKTQYEKELVDTRQKYADLVQMAHGNKEQLKQIEEQFQKEVAALQDKYYEDAFKKGDIKFQQYSQKVLKSFSEGMSKNKITPAEAKKLYDGMADELGNKASTELGNRRSTNELRVEVGKGRARREALLQQLKDEELIEINQAGITAEQVTLIHQKYAEKQAAVIKETFIANVGLILDFAQGATQLLDRIFQIEANRENAQLARDKAINDKKKSNLDKQLKGKLISQNQYNNATAKLDADYDRKKKDLEVKQFRRNQKMQIAQALISGAQGALSVLAAVPGPIDILSLGTVRSIMLGITAAITAAEVAAIATQKPPEGRRGLIVSGPSHEGGGVDLVERRSGRTVANVEGGEPLWVFSKDTYRNNKAILDQLIYNSMFRQGASIMPSFKNAYTPINASRMVPIMKDGGVVNSQAATVQDDEGKMILISLRNEMADLRTDLNSWNRDLKATVSLRDINSQTSMLQAAKNASSLKQ